MGGARLGHVLLVDVVRFGDISNHGSQVYPVVAIEQSTAYQGNGDTLVLLFRGAGACIFVDTRETGGNGAVGGKAEVFGDVIGKLSGCRIIQFVLYHLVRSFRVNIRGYSATVACHWKEEE